MAIDPLPTTPTRLDHVVDGLFAIGTALLFLFVGLILARAPIVYANTAAASAGALLALGVCLSSYSIWKRAWQRPASATLMAIAHAVALLVANAMARTTLTQATGLPGQDFDWAVSMLTLLLYIPAWISVGAVVLGIVALVGQLWMFAQLLVAPRSKGTWRTMCRVGGIAAGSLFLAHASDVYQRHQGALKPVALFLAVTGDYQRVQAHPSLPAGTLAKFHGDGVVSVFDDQSKTITVRKLAE